MNTNVGTINILHIPSHLIFQRWAYLILICHCLDAETETQLGNVLGCQDRSVQAVSFLVQVSGQSQSNLSHSLVKTVPPRYSPSIILYL